MGLKLLWIGLTLIVAFNAALSLIGLGGNAVIPEIGAVIMLIGAVLFALDK